MFGEGGRLIEVVRHPERLLAGIPYAPLVFRVALPDGSTRMSSENALFRPSGDRQTWEPVPQGRRP